MKTPHQGWSTVSVTSKVAKVWHCEKRAARWASLGGRWKCDVCGDISEFTSPQQRGPNHVPDRWDSTVAGAELSDKAKAVIVRQAVEVLELVRLHSQRFGDEIAIVSWAAEKYADVLDPKPVRHIRLRSD